MPSEYRNCSCIGQNPYCTKCGGKGWYEEWVDFSFSDTEKRLKERKPLFGWLWRKKQSQAFEDLPFERQAEIATDEALEEMIRRRNRRSFWEWFTTPRPRNRKRRGPLWILLIIFFIFSLLLFGAPK